MLSLPHANEVCEGYAFTGVSLSTGEAARQGGIARPPADTDEIRLMSKRYASYKNAFLFSRMYLPPAIDGTISIFSVLLKGGGIKTGFWHVCDC